MRTKILYTDPNTKAYIEMAEFREGSSDEYDNIHSYSVRQMKIRTANDLPLKLFRSTHCKMGKGRSAQIADMLQQAKGWLSSYTYHAKYPPKEFGCNCMLLYPCAYMQAGDDGRAKCSIKPDHYGYSGHRNARDVPADRKCDLFTIMGRESRRSFGGTIPGHPLTMSEIWECISGEAKSKLYPETTGEKPDEQQADHF